MPAVVEDLLRAGRPVCCVNIRARGEMAGAVALAQAGLQPLAVKAKETLYHGTQATTALAMSAQAPEAVESAFSVQRRGQLFSWPAYVSRIRDVEREALTGLRWEVSV